MNVICDFKMNFKGKSVTFTDKRAFLKNEWS